MLIYIKTYKRPKFCSLPAGLRLQFQVMNFSSLTYFSNMLCAVELRVLGLMAYLYTGSAFHQIPQSYLNDVHLVPSVVLRDNELLTKFLWI